MGSEGAADIFGVKLCTDEEGVALDLDGFDELPVGGSAGNDHTFLGKALFVFVVEFVTVTVPLGNEGFFIN